MGIAEPEGGSEKPPASAVGMIRTVPPLREDEEMTITRHRRPATWVVMLRWVWLIISGACAFLLALLVATVLIENTRRAESERTLRLKIESQRALLLDYMSSRDELMERVAAKQDVPQDVIDAVKAKSEAAIKSLEK